LTAVGAARGYSDPNCGFVVYAPHAFSPGDDTYLEVEYGRSEVGFKWIRPQMLSGLNAIRTVLDGLDLGRSDLDLDHAFDAVLGPAVSALNGDRLAQTVAFEEVAFGTAPRKPLASLVIPLYGRIDYLDYQMALHSQDPSHAGHDIIYVLDDPPRRADVLTLAESVFERFRIPFRVLMPSTNLGFGPASNLGLQAAKGRYVAFINSDIFPITPNGVGKLIDTLQAQPKMGAIGPRLLFDDGSVQHEGCVFRSLRDHGGWHFVDHTNKGRRPEPSQEVAACEAITGAYLVMARALAEELGGFDQRYVVGDFEDADLCLRIRAKGLTVGVDRGVEAFHLERQSQVAPSTAWRRNLTLFNAWQHERRWFPKNGAEGARTVRAERKAGLR
jgi:GT2 family glycosyltransferase